MYDCHDIMYRHTRIHTCAYSRRCIRNYVPWSSKTRQVLPFTWCDVLRISAQFLPTLFEFSYVSTPQHQWTLCLGLCCEGKLSLTSPQAPEGGTPPARLIPGQWLAPACTTGFLGVKGPALSMALSWPFPPRRRRGPTAVPGGGLASSLACFSSQLFRLSGKLLPSGPWVWVCQHWKFEFEVGRERVGVG